LHETHHVEDLVEASLAFVLPAHKGKEMVNFGYTDGLMKETLDVVDQHVDTFIRIEKHIWDMGCFIFDGDPIYDIDGTFQVKNA
jgi:hypothetical protein